MAEQSSKVKFNSLESGDVQQVDSQTKGDVRRKQSDKDDSEFSETIWIRESNRESDTIVKEFFTQKVAFETFNTRKLCVSRS